MKENYNLPEDFLMDESFVKWARGIEGNDSAEWNQWLLQNPSMQDIVSKAKNILSLTQIQEPPPDEEKLNRAEARLRKALANEEIRMPAKVVGLKRKMYWYWAAAAVIIISMSIGIFSMPDRPQKLEMASNYGEIRKNKLPDGTEVILNANSKITLQKNWKEGQDREVWIKGEAFFYVNKTPKRDKFIVHTDAFDIEVTGTSFNVINENGKSSVILKEGSVNIIRNGKKELAMKPGDFVEFSGQQLQQKKITRDDYMAWTANRIVFENTALTGVAEIIRNHYGVNVKLDKAVLQKTITGIMPNDNLDVLLQSLNAMQEFKVVKTEDTIFIREFK